MRKLPLILSVVIAIFLLTITLQRGLTQDGANSCPTLVKQALEAVGNNCGGLTRNSACYGFNRVNATFSEDVSDGSFSKPSDQAGLKTLQSIDTAPLSDALKEWGVAVMSVQANIPNSLPGQAISFVLLGDVSVDNAVPADQAVAPAATPIAVTTLNTANIRTLPTTNSNVVGSVDGAAALSADAINPTKDWVRVVFGNKTPGWISRALVKTDGDLDSLPVFANDSKTPMQAFYFKTGIGAPACSKSPDLLVVQGPDKVAVDITANGANIRIGSTIALRTIEGNKMQIITVHGSAKVNGVVVPIGYTTTVQLSEDGKSIVGQPDLPKPLTQEELDELQWLELVPADVLNYPLVIPNAPPKPQITIPVTTNGAPGGGSPPNGRVDCKPFKATSPLDGLNFGMNAFYWDAAPGATSYRINVQGAGSKEITAPTTTISFDISGAGFNPQLTWSVDALFNGQVMCSSQSVTIPRQWAAPPPPT
nr:SH3 domain-containing protein [Anaerolineae bacterium]